MTAKELLNEHWMEGIELYTLDKEDMQAFIDQLCREYFENIAEAIEKAAENDELGTVESILIAMGNAPKPTI